MADTISWKTASLLLALGLIVAGPAYEQNAAGQSTAPGAGEAKRNKQPKRRRPARQGLSPAQVLVQRFDRTAPQIGDLLPDVAAFDAEGNRFHLRSLQGQYSVLIFGCLT